MKIPETKDMHISFIFYYLVCLMLFIIIFIQKNTHLSEHPHCKKYIVVAD